MASDPFYLPPEPPEPSTPEGKAAAEAREKYLLELGRFVVSFAALEASLFWLLGCLSGMPIQIAKALLSDVRADAAMSKISRVLAARRLMGFPSDVEDRISGYVTKVTQQIGIINGMRNLLLHYGTAEPHAPEPLVSNWSRALDDLRLREVRISVTDLMDMRHDIVTATVTISAVLHIIEWPHLPVPENLLKYEDNTPWQYKSPLQGGKKDKNQKTSPGQQPPPQSSQESPQ